MKLIQPITINSCKIIKLNSLLFFAILPSLLSACNSATSSHSNVETQNSIYQNFMQRRQIVLKSLSEKKVPIIPSSLKLDSEKYITQLGTSTQSLLGAPAYSVLGGALLAGNPCIIMSDLSESGMYTPPQQDSVQIIKTSSENSGEQNSAVNATLSVGAGLFSANASMDLTNSSLFSSSAIGFKVVASIAGEHGSRTFYDNSSVTKLLNPAYISWRALNNKFYSQCGDSFVDKERFGATVSAVMNIKFENQQQASSFGASLGGSYGSFGSLSTAINQDEKSKQSNASVEIKVIQDGGIPGELLKNGVSKEGLIKCSLDNFAECEAAMMKVLEYAGTLQSQILDANQNILLNRVSYTAPQTVKYAKLVSLGNDNAISAQGKEAIDKLNDLYKKTILLYYGMDDMNRLLKNKGYENFKNQAYDKIVAREQYITNVSATCYSSPDTCATKILPQLIEDFNKNDALKIDPINLKFYSKIYTSSNLLALNSMFGTANNYTKDYTVVLIPNLYASDSNQSYVNLSQIPECNEDICSAGKMVVVKRLDDTTDHYKISFNNIKSLNEDCNPSSYEDNLKCTGYSTPVKGSSKVLNWRDDWSYSNIGNLSDQQLQQYATPKL